MGASAITDMWHRSSRALLGQRRVSVLRWMRAQSDLRHLAQADVAVVAFAKSGRTWLRVMLSRLFQVKYSLPEEMVIERGNLHRANAAVPVFLFTQGSYIADLRPVGGPDSPYRDKRLMFLARHPADTAVSYYFHVHNRINPLKRDVKRLPADLSETPLFDFLMNEAWGMPAIVDYLNAWADALPQHPRHLLLHYENLRHDPRGELQRIAEFIGEDFAPDAYDEAVSFASFERLQQKERADFFRNHRLRPRDRDNLNSYKVRRGKVGGYRDYLNEDEIARVDRHIARHLHPVYGYSAAAARETPSPMHSAGAAAPAPEDP